jgi:hypothetical protein
LSENEIAAAAIADNGGVFNPQQQFPVRWPDEPVVARAYLDQLQRDAALPASMLADMSAALDNSESVLGAGASDKDLAARLESLATALAGNSGNAVVKKRQAALAETLGGIAARLR